MKPFWVYILRCSDGSYYVGHTDDLEKRVGEHQSGAIPGYTTNRRPVSLVFASDTVTRDQAILTEMRVKRWTRAKKEALIQGDWGRLKSLSRGSNNVRPSTSGRTGGSR